MPAPVWILPKNFYSKQKPKHTEIGRETAEWILKEELKHYTHIVLIDTAVADIVPLRKRAIENARFFNMAFEEIEGKNLKYFVKLIKGPYDAKDFIVLKPGEAVTQSMFIG